MSFLPDCSRRAVCRLLLAAGLLLASLAARAQQDAVAQSSGFDPMAQRYSLGQGLRLGNGFALGGYATASTGEHGSDRTGYDADQSWRSGLDSLSSFLWWDNGARWHFFSELELEDALVAHDDTLTARGAEVELERFYVDYESSDLLKFRLGKFLTPVGRWNLIHASPLVWTTARPLITERTFPTNATGAMVYGLLPLTDNGIEYSLYYSPGIELARDRDLDPFEEAVGAHFTYTPLSGLQLGLSYANFEQRHSGDEHRNLVGLDFVWSQHRWELSGELHYRHSQGEEYDRDETGYYLQTVAPLTARLYAVARYESLHRSDAGRALDLYLGGLNFRVRPGIVFKAEYSHARNADEALDEPAGGGDIYATVPDGFLASLAVLF